MNVKDILDIKRRRLVRYQVSKAVRHGKLVKPDTCSLCCEKTKEICAHHIDYGKPLEVTWLCTTCHGLAHRKHHPLNPCNNDQTPIPYLHDHQEQVQVSVLLPISSFLELQRESEKLSQPIAKILKKQIMEKYPTYSPQLEFNFMACDDHSQQTQHERVSGMVQNKDCLHQSEIVTIQNLWREGHISVPKMERQLPGILFRYGGDAQKVQRFRAN